MRPLPLLLLVLANLLAWVGYHHWQEGRRAHPRLLERPAEGAALGGRELRWRFDRPMAAPADGDPVTLSPPVAGEFLWSDPTTLLFLPDSTGLPKATTVAWRIEPARLAAGDGPALAEAAAGTLATAPLTVQEVRLGARLDDGRHELELHFDDAVEAADLARHLRVTCGGTPVALEPAGPLPTATGAALGPYQALAGPPGSAWRFLAGPPPGDGRLEVTVAAGLAGRAGPLPLPADHRAVLDWSGRLRLERVEGDYDGPRPLIQLRLNRRCPRAALAEVLAVEPAVACSLVERWGGWALAGDFRPSTRYTVVIRPAPERSAVEHPLPERLPAWIGEPPPRAWFPAGHGRVDGRDRRVALQVCNLARVRVQAFRVCDGNLAAWRLHGRWQADRFARPAAERVLAVAPGQERLVLDLDQLAGGAAEGAWHLRASWRADDVRAGDHRWGGSDECTLTVADLGLVAHLGGGACTVWALSLSGGAPLAGVRVRAVSDRLQEAGEAVTGADGVATLALAPLPADEEPTLLVASHQGRSTWLDLRHLAVRDGGADAGGRPRQALEAYLWTPRGAYRPGETLHARALVRGAGGGTPGPCPVRWRVLRPDLREWTVRSAELADGAAGLDLELPADLPTGRWQLELAAPGAERPWGACAFQVEEFVPQRLAVAATAACTAEGGAVLAVQAAWLAGGPAAGRPARPALRWRPAPFAPPGWAGWAFLDAAGLEPMRGVEPPVGGRWDPAERALDAAGAARWDIPAASLPATAATPWALSASVAVLEAGGRGTTAWTACTLDRLPARLGLRRVAGGDPLRPAVEVRLVRADGGLAAEARALRWSLWRQQWNTVLVHDGRQRWPRWQSQAVAAPAGVEGAAELAAGAALITVPLPDAGDWVLRVAGADGPDAATLAIDGGEQWDGTLDRSHPERLALTLAGGDGEGRFAPGATAAVTVASPFPGRLLLAVMTDRVVAHRVVDMERSTRRIELPVEAAWGGEAHLCATVVRAHDGAAGSRRLLGGGGPSGPERSGGAAPVQTTTWDGEAGPRDAVADPAERGKLFAKAPRLRAYGVARLRLAEPGRRLALALELPAAARPGTTVAVTALAAPGAQVAFAAVDEGVLALTRHGDPDPAGFFAAARALATVCHDVYGEMLPLLPRPGGAAEPGGDHALGRALTPVPAQRVRPVALWGGTVAAGADGRARWLAAIPAGFDGRLRVMALADRGAALGGAAAALPVRAPLAVKGHWPLFLAPGDRAEVAVEVVDRAGGGPAALTVAAEGPLAAVVEGGRVLLTAGAAPGVARLRLTARSGGENAEDEVELPVRPPWPAVVLGGELAVEPGRPQALAAPAGLLPATVRLRASLAPRARLGLDAGLAGLLAYPHGCAEQTLSGLAPLPALGTLLPAIDPAWGDRAMIARRIADGCARLEAMRGDDGLAMWPGGGEAWPWATAYGAWVLTEIQAGGHAVPPALLDRLLDACRRLARRGDDATAALAALALARAGRDEPGLLERLDARTEAGEARLLLGLAWTAAGRPARAAALVPAALPAAPRRLDGDLASPVRERALLLRLLLAIDPQHPAAAGHAAALADRRSWASTQDAAWALGALAEWVRQVPATPAPERLHLEVAGRAVDPAGWSGGAASVAAAVEGAPGSRAWLAWTASGVPTEAPPAGDHGLRLRRRWLAEDGGALPARLRPGDLVRVELTVEADQALPHVVVVDPLPAAFAVENPRLDGSAAGADRAGGMVDVRDDRVVVVGRAGPDKAALRAGYLARVVAAGSFAVPPAQAECMYDAGTWSRTAAGRLETGGDPGPAR